MRTTSGVPFHSLGLTYEPKCPDDPTKCVLKACTHLLQCVTLGLSAHADGLRPQTAHSVASLFQHILFSNLKGICGIRLL